MTMNRKQTLVVQGWLVLVVLLALFPPLTTKRRDWFGIRNGVPFHTVGTKTQHGFILHNDWGPWLNYSTQDTIVDIPSNQVQETETTINLRALFCELLAITAGAGLALLTLKGKIHEEG